MPASFTTELLPLCNKTKSLSAPNVICSLSPRCTPSVTRVPVSVAPLEVVTNFVFVECLRVTPLLPPNISVPAKAAVPDCPIVNAEPHSASIIVLI